MMYEIRAQIAQSGARARSESTTSADAEGSPVSSDGKFYRWQPSGEGSLEKISLENLQEGKRIRKPAPEPIVQPQFTREPSKPSEPEHSPTPSRPRDTERRGRGKGRKASQSGRPKVNRNTRSASDHPKLAILQSSTSQLAKSPKITDPSDSPSEAEPPASGPGWELDGREVCEPREEALAFSEGDSTLTTISVDSFVDYSADNLEGTKIDSEPSYTPSTEMPSSDSETVRRIKHPQAEHGAAFQTNAKSFPPVKEGTSERELLKQQTLEPRGERDSSTLSVLQSPDASQEASDAVPRTLPPTMQDEIASSSSSLVLTSDRGADSESHAKVRTSSPEICDAMLPPIVRATVAHLRTVLDHADASQERKFSESVTIECGYVSGEYPEPEEDDEGEFGDDGYNDETLRLGSSRGGSSVSRSADEVQQGKDEKFQDHGHPSTKIPSATQACARAGKADRDERADSTPCDDGEVCAIACLACRPESEAAVSDDTPIPLADVAIDVRSSGADCGQTGTAASESSTLSRDDPTSVSQQVHRSRASAASKSARRYALAIRRIDGKYFRQQLGLCSSGTTARFWGCCRACQRRYRKDQPNPFKGNDCAFQRLRWLPCKADGSVLRPVQGRNRLKVRERVRFLSQPTDFDSPLLPSSDEFNGLLSMADIVTIEQVSAKHLIEVVQRTLNHSMLPGCVIRAHDHAARELCSFCQTSIFSAAFKCRVCGSDYCSQCTNVITRNFEETGSETPPADAQTDAVGYTLFSCRTPNTYHDPSDFFPTVMHNAEELEHHLSAMKLVTKREQSAGTLSVSKAIGVAPLDTQSTSARPDNSASSGECGKAISLTENGYFSWRDDDLQSDIDKEVGSLSVLQAPSATYLNDHIAEVWHHGQPIVCLDLSPNAKSAWNPRVLSSLYGNVECTIKLSGRLRNGSQGMECSTTAGQYYAAIGRTPDEKLSTFGASEVKMVDFPKDARLRDAFPELNADFEKMVPASDMTRADGKRNIASYHPNCESKTDLGPKMYNAGPGSQNEGGNGKGGTTRLHMDASDAVNIMLWCDKPDGAAWDLFDHHDSDKIRGFLRRHFHLPLNVDPIHSQQYYIDEILRRKLWEEERVKSWRIYQKQGEAVFIPAACAHQVCNLAECIKIATDFISPENVDRCFQLKSEFQRLGWKEDILQLEMSLWFAWLASQELRREHEGGGVEARDDYQRRTKVHPTLKMQASNRTVRKGAASRKPRQITPDDSADCSQPPRKGTKFALVIPARNAAGDVEVARPCRTRPVRSALQRRPRYQDGEEGEEDEEEEGENDYEHEHEADHGHEIYEGRDQGFQPLEMDFRKSRERSSFSLTVERKRKSMTHGDGAEASSSKRPKSSVASGSGAYHQRKSGQTSFREATSLFEKAFAEAQAAQKEAHRAARENAHSRTEQNERHLRNASERSLRCQKDLVMAHNHLNNVQVAMLDAAIDP